MEAVINMKSESKIGFLRPYLSAKGPHINCPIANPAKNVEREICTADVVVLKYPEMLMNAGKYKSMLNGSKAVRSERIMMIIH